MSEDKNDKNIEDEIEELLGKIDDFPEDTTPKEPRFEAVREFISELSNKITIPVSSLLSRVTVGNLVLWAVVLIVTSMIVRKVFPLAVWGVPLGLALLVAAFGMIVFGTNSSSGIEQMWRGKTIEFKQPPLMFRLWRKVRALFRR